jgi:hypothetical protein
MNAISEIRRGRDPNVRAWACEAEDVDLHLSVLTLGEIRKGIERLANRDPLRRGSLPSGSTNCGNASLPEFLKSTPASLKNRAASTPALLETLSAA